MEDVLPISLVFLLNKMNLDVLHFHLNICLHLIFRKHTNIILSSLFVIEKQLLSCISLCILAG